MHHIQRLEQHGAKRYTHAPEIPFSPLLPTPYISLLHSVRAKASNQLHFINCDEVALCVCFFGSLTHCCSLIFQKKENELDSLEWSRKFDIFSISRLSLNASGIPVELVQSLSDEDMQAIADQIAHLVVQEPIEQIAEFVARLYLAEKGGRSGNTKPLQQDRET